MSSEPEDELVPPEQAKPAKKAAKLKPAKMAAKLKPAAKPAC